jgi:hypothetical protein
LASELVALRNYWRCAPYFLRRSSLRRWPLRRSMSPGGPESFLRRSSLLRRSLLLRSAPSGVSEPVPVSSLVTLPCLTSPLLVAMDRQKVPVEIQRRCHWARPRNKNPFIYGASFGDFNAISSQPLLKTQTTAPSTRHQWVWWREIFARTYSAAGADLTSRRTAPLNGAATVNVKTREDRLNFDLQSPFKVAGQTSNWHRFRGASLDSNLTGQTLHGSSLLRLSGLSIINVFQLSSK